MAKARRKAQRRETITPSETRQTVKRWVQSYGEDTATLFANLADDVANRMTLAANQAVRGRVMQLHKAGLLSFDEASLICEDIKDEIYKVYAAIADGAADA